MFEAAGIRFKPRMTSKIYGLRFHRADILSAANTECANQTRYHSFVILWLTSEKYGQRYGEGLVKASHNYTVSTIEQGR